MAINETGYEITVGPDKNGAHFTVAPGAEYELPEPPESVPADEQVADALADLTDAAGDAAAASADLADTTKQLSTATKAKAKPAAAADTTTEPATGDTQKG